MGDTLELCSIVFFDIPSCGGGDLRHGGRYLMMATNEGFGKAFVSSCPGFQDSGAIDNAVFLVL